MRPRQSGQVFITLEVQTIYTQPKTQKKKKKLSAEVEVTRDRNIINERKATQAAKTNGKTIPSQNIL